MRKVAVHENAHHACRSGGCNACTEGRACPVGDRGSGARVGLGGDYGVGFAGDGPRQWKAGGDPADAAALQSRMGRQHPQTRRRALVGRDEHKPRAGQLCRAMGRCECRGQGEGEEFAHGFGEGATE